jgi:hypothetical protein
MSLCSLHFLRMSVESKNRPTTRTSGFPSETGGLLLQGDRHQRLQTPRFILARVRHGLRFFSRRMSLFPPDVETSASMQTHLNAGNNLLTFPLEYPCCLLRSLLHRTCRLDHTGETIFAEALGHSLCTSRYDLPLLEGARRGRRIHAGLHGPKIIRYPTKKLPSIMSASLATQLKNRI